MTKAHNKYLLKFKFKWTKTENIKKLIQNINKYYNSLQIILTKLCSGITNPIVLPCPITYLSQRHDFSQFSQFPKNKITIK